MLAGYIVFHQIRETCRRVFTKNNQILNAKHAHPLVCVLQVCERNASAKRCIHRASNKWRLFSSLFGIGRERQPLTNLRPRHPTTTTTTTAASVAARFAETDIHKAHCTHPKITVTDSQWVGGWVNEHCTDDILQNNNKGGKIKQQRRRLEPKLQNVQGIKNDFCYGVVFNLRFHMISGLFHLLLCHVVNEINVYLCSMHLWLLSYIVFCYFCCFCCCCCFWCCDATANTAHSRHGSSVSEVFFIVLLFYFSMLFLQFLEWIRASGTLRFHRM